MEESQEELRQRLGPMAYAVTQNAATEPAFTGEAERLSLAHWISMILVAAGLPLVNPLIIAG